MKNLYFLPFIALMFLSACNEQGQTTVHTAVSPDQGSKPQNTQNSNSEPSSSDQYIAVGSPQGQYLPGFASSERYVMKTSTITVQTAGTF